MFHIKQDFLINEQIRFATIQVIDENGQKLENMSSKQAQDLADERNLDLVLVSPNANPPVCKILDYSKFKFEMAKKAKEVKKNQKVVEIKEIRISPNIDLHDLEVKAKNAIKFLASGDKVKVTMRFRGRELNFINQGKEIMNNFKDIIGECQIEKEIKLEGKNLTCVLAPKQK
ncbi:MAG: translation initiation factor IF-3 [Clostridia bacterium]|nr:translation initiation factor IF-3 [Clostridia bacterium]